MLASRALICLSLVHASVAQSCVIPNLPSLFLEGKTRASVAGCIVGTQIQSGDRCGVQCLTGYDELVAGTAATANYVCTNGVLTQPSLTCTPGSCTFPAMPEGTKPSSTATKCEANKVMKHNEICSIECDANNGYTLAGVITTYICAFKKITTTNVVDAAANLCKKRQCQVPLFDDTVNGLEYVATAVPTLDPTYVIYKTTNSPTITPTGFDRFVSLGVTTKFDSVDPQNPTLCKAQSKMEQGQKCRARCKDGWQNYKPSPTTGDPWPDANKIANEQPVECSSQAPFLFKDGYWPFNCRPKSCAMPQQFNLELQGGGWPFCQPGSMLESGSSCTVKCSPGYVATGGNDKFSCVEGKLTSATLECSPVSSCKLPLLFAAGVEGGTSNLNWGAATSRTYPGTNTQYPNVPCRNNGLLPGGTRCYVRCVAGFAPLYSDKYTSTVSDPRSYYECVQNTLVPPSLLCSTASFVTITATCPNTNPNDQVPYERLLQDAGSILIAPLQQIGLTVAGRGDSKFEVRWTVPADEKAKDVLALISEGARLRLPKTVEDLGCTVTTSNLIAATCVYQKDSLCFDSLYPCESCCTTDKGKNGVSCWDELYTKFKCCKGVSAPQTATPTTASPTASPVEFSSFFTKPPSPTLAMLNCFDYFYPKDQCCTVGRGILGDTCWNGQFSAPKCCDTTSVVNIVKTPSPTFYIPDVTFSPTFGCPYERDRACFNANYPCKQCCETGISKVGADYSGSCWDALYSYERCCLGGKLQQSQLCTVEDSQKLIFSVDQASKLTNLGCKACILDCLNTYGLDKPDLRLECVIRCQPFLGVATSVVAPTNVFDTLDVCPAWAASGQCAETWVQGFCPASCVKFIQVAQGLRTASPCIDQDPLCPTWAKLGECNSGTAAVQFVRRTCKFSCRAIVPCATRRAPSENDVMTQSDDDGHIVDSRGHDFGLRVTVDATGRLFDSRGNALPRPEDFDSRGHLLPKEPESSGSAVWIGVAGGVGGATCLAAAILFFVRRNRSPSVARSQQVQGDISASASC